MPRLVVEKGNDRGRTFPVEPGGSVVFGREPDANVQIRDTQCSRHHFRVEDRGVKEGWWLVDLGSMNGTLLNGRRVDKEKKLGFGDLIKIGETLFSFLSDQPDPAESMIGMRLGGYEISERVGRGGMGTVYKAEQIDLQRHVALKVIAAEHLKKKDFIELFVREARAAARLNHANIVQVYDVKKLNELYYFSMEFVPGGSVQDLLNRERKVPIGQTVSMILDAARGLEYAHKKDVIHRDVKPDNFMISETGAIKIGDLGLAQRLGEKLATDDEDTVVGTPHYIAPEQVLGKPADYRSDIYALGATMYRMIAGFTPHQAPSVRELVNKKVREDAVPLHQAIAGLAPRVGEVCAKMMARKPEERYQTMTEVIGELEKLQRELAGEARATETVGNRKLLAAAVVLLAFVAVGGIVGAVAFFKRAPEQTTATTTPPVAEPSEAAKADAQLEDAKKYERELMDRNKPEDLDRALKQYAAVVLRYPGSYAATEAEAAIATVNLRLVEVRSDLAFAEVEKVDRDNWQRMYRTFQEGRTDLAPVQEAVDAYEKFGADEQWKDTPAAKRANACAQFIAMWKARVAELQTQYEKVSAAASAKRDEGRFNDAWLMLDEFAKKALASKMKCDFASDRYESMLLEQTAREAQRKVVKSAEVAYDRVEEKVREMEKERQYAAALELLKGVVPNFPEDRQPKDEVAAKVRALENRLLESQAHFRADEAARIAREAEEARAADATAFEQLCREARRDVLAADFKSAAARVAARTFRTEPFRERAQRRASEFAALQEMKDAVRKAINDPKGVKRKSPFLGTTGTVVSMDEKEFVIRADQEQGTMALAIKEVKPALLYPFMKGATKWTDPKVIAGLALYCIEAGLYDDALAELAALAPYAREKGVAEFAEHYRKAIESAGYTDCDETEAEKRFARLKAFPAQTALETVQREIDLLRTRYKDTRFVAGHRAELDAMLEDLLKRGGEQMKKKRRLEQYQKIWDHRNGVKAEIVKNRDEILARINRIEDQVWKEARLGEFWMSYGDLPKALERLAVAKEWGDKLVDSRMAKEYAYLVSTVYLQIYRCCIMIPNSRLAAEIREQMDKRSGNPNWTRHVPFWDETVKRLELWELRFREKREQLAAMERAVQETPEDPRRLWELADGLVAARQYVDARTCLSALIALHPTSPQVANGEAQVLLADVLASFHEMTAALAAYQAVQTTFPDHPRVREQMGPDSVRRRIEALLLLRERMGMKP